MVSAVVERPKRVKREPLLGFEEPRIFTPPLRPLTPETSLGFDVITFSEDVLEITLAPWERWLFIHLLELLPNGHLRFRTAIVLVARQNGKTMMSVILALFFMYVLGKRLVIGTAQNLDIAEDTWAEALALIEDIPELAEQKAKVIEGNGRKTIILKTRERYRVKAANRKAGRGLSGNLVLVDELREHQTWDAWGALTKTTMARASSLVLALSNAGDASSIVLRYLRKVAHAALGDPDGINAIDDPASLLPTLAEMEPENPYDYEEDDPDALGIFEWSADPKADKRDRRAWAQANPSCGYTELNERAIAAACHSDPDFLFKTEVLCQWPDGGVNGPFPTEAWSYSTDPESRRRKSARVSACVDVSSDGMMTRIGVCATRKDGAGHVELIASRPGTDWVKGWILDKHHPERRKFRWTGQGRGAPVSALVAKMQTWVDKDGEPLLDVTPWQGDELSRGHAEFFSAVCGLSGADEIDVDDLFDGDAKPQPRVFHRPSPILDVAAGVGATKVLGDGGWVLDRMKSPVDVSGLFTVIGAHWLWLQPEEERKVSAYEHHRLEMI